MKSDPKVIEVLNSLLSDELTATNQYMVHSEMCDNWGYELLHQAIEKQAMEEMQHAEWLIKRILFLEGIPVVSKLNPIKIGKTVEDMVLNDKKSEEGAVRAYNSAITLAHHLDWDEAQRDQIEQMGLQNYLANQTGTPA